MPKEPLRWADSEQLGKWFEQTRLKIPYLSCVRPQPYPGGVHSSVGTYKRTENSTRIDGQIEDGSGSKVGVAESKSHERNVGKSIMIPVVQRFEGHGVSVGFVVVSNLAAIQERLESQDTNVLKLLVKEEKVSLESIGKVKVPGRSRMQEQTAQRRQKLLIVVECDEKMLRQRFQSDSGIGRAYRYFLDRKNT